MKQIKTKINGNWIKLKTHHNRLVNIKFQIIKSGELSYIEIERSSGDKTYDEIALETIKKSAPFMPLPNDYIGNSLNINYTFKTTVNRFKGY